MKNLFKKYDKVILKEYSKNQLRHDIFIKKNNLKRVKSMLRITKMANYAAIEDWCEENCLGNFLICGAGDFFEFESDEIKFILKWF